MRISDVRVVLHDRKEGDLDVFGVEDGRLPMGVLTISTDEGVEGHNFLSLPGPGPAIVAEQIVRHLKPILLGRNPLDIGAIWADLHRASRSVDPIAIGTIDVALWDIAGKVAGLPVHRLLGTCREKVPVYFSSGHHDRAEDYAEEALYWRDQGWKAYKLHPPSAPWRAGGDDHVAACVAACRAVRTAVGDGMELMLDATWAYTYQEALRVGRVLEELDYYWYEDPLPADDIHGYRRLREKLDVPILATELTPGGVYALPAWITARATDFLRGDVVIKGGITGMIKIAHLAEAFRMGCEVHDGYNALGNAAGLHVVMAIPNCEWFEVLAFNRAGHHSLEHLSYGLTEPIEIDADGHVHAPTRPGLGFDVDWELIDSARVGEVG